MALILALLTFLALLVITTLLTHMAVAVILGFLTLTEAMSLITIEVLLPGKSHGWRSLVGSSPWGR